MTKEELVKEAKERAEKLEGSQTLGVYDNDDLTYDEGYNKGQVAGYEEGYLAGAEPREKRIAELKETNKKISDNCHKFVDSLEKLQNENAELKDKNKALEQYADLADAKVDEVKGNLTKAKELLKNFVTLDKDYDWNLQLAYDAEQFLSEVEK